VQLRLIALGLVMLVVASTGLAVIWATASTGQEVGKPESRWGCDLPSDYEKLPPEKQSLELDMRSECEAAQAGYHAPKPTNQSPVLSCPLDLTYIQTGIFPFTFQKFPGGRNGSNFASAISSGGVPYTIFAGAQDNDVQQGVIFVKEESTDPCAEAAGRLTRLDQDFILPAKTGPVTLTAIEGDFVSFETSGGSKGRFNYTTGEFILP